MFFIGVQEISCLRKDEGIGSGKTPCVEAASVQVERVLDLHSEALLCADLAMRSWGSHLAQLDDIFLIYEKGDQASLSQVDSFK
jgi:hypothetical protein